MASIRKNFDKDGNFISASIRVYKGRDAHGKQLKPYIMTWQVPEGKSDKYIQRELNKAATLFEEECRKGTVLDNRQTFAAYADYVMKLKVSQGRADKTLEGYEEKLKRINAEIGHYKLADITPQLLNQFYTKLMAEGMRENADRAQSRIDIKQFIKDNKILMKDICAKAHISDSTLRDAIKGKLIMPETARKIAEAVGVDVRVLFDIISNNTPLSKVTILGVHRTVSVILREAVKERRITYNPASCVTPPSSIATSEANYLQVHELQKVLESLEKESIKWQMGLYLLIVTGARRGEIVGLKWQDIDFDKSTISINKSVSALKNKQISVHKPKNVFSRRVISVPEETIELLIQYKEWYDEQKRKYGEEWHDTGYLFVQTKKGNVGKPCNPSSFNQFLKRFAQKNNIKHLNPHAFRHALASVLIHSGADIISISRRLGHARVSTTLNLYGHLMDNADNDTSELYADIILRKKNSEE